ncbi:unnamed protein product [Blepharisma stoltei]|uniref:Uncharacterized protein n=1 Tax=Blepharisma stoltei TaxID=1481888 RepID=A0AAU9JA88_9CILI|nr:unnamed protein product [Blepharisma stoltei]
MLRGNERVYALEKGGRIFESAESNIFSCAQKETNSMPGSINQSSIVRYKSCLYFVLYNNALWKFDLASKQLSDVGTV